MLLFRTNSFAYIQIVTEMMTDMVLIVQKPSRSCVIVRIKGRCDAEYFFDSLAKSTIKQVILFTLFPHDAGPVVHHPSLHNNCL